jgi:biofilm protein TabA
MIFDHLRNLASYRSLSPTFAVAIDYLGRTDLDSLDIGRFEIAGTDVYAMVQSYETKAPEQAKWETHRRYADIQVLIEGAERMDYADAEGLSVLTPYDSAKDAGFYSPPPEFVSLIVRPRTFAIFLPQDAHRPTVAVTGPETIRKIVVKVAV